jgi:hypothetical protein
VVVIRKKLVWEEQDKIPTAFVSLAPEKLLIDRDIDVLVGLFHIMWEDMPRPRTYSIRLADSVSRLGSYLGCSLCFGSSNNGPSMVLVLNA